MSMDRMPPELLTRIVHILPHADVSRLMRAGSLQLYAVAGMRLYETIRLKLAVQTLPPTANILRFHGRDMMEFLSGDRPPGRLDHPTQWLRHLSLAWPAFPSEEEDKRLCESTLRLFSRTAGLLSLELNGRPLPAWDRHTRGFARSRHLLPNLAALKTDAVQDSIYFTDHRQLKSLFVNVTSFSSSDLDQLIDVARHSAPSMRQLQLSVEVDTIESVVSSFDKIATAFPRLSVLCLEFDLGSKSPERPLSWRTMKASVVPHVGKYTDTHCRTYCPTLEG